MEKKEKIIYLALLIFVLLALIYSISTLFSTGMVVRNEENYEKFVANELEDKCKTPPGYSNEQWKEHMSHHPERYVGC